jgi:hypothetical protein
MMAIAELAWSKRLTDIGQDVVTLNHLSRRGRPAEMLPAARKLADDANALVAWLQVAEAAHES